MSWCITAWAALDVKLLSIYKYNEQNYNEQTTPGEDLWSNPVAVAELLQLWTDAQSAARGGARSGLIWDWTGKKVSKYELFIELDT